MEVASREFERVKMAGSKVELAQFLRTTEASDAGRKDLDKKGGMLARRPERLMKDIRDRAARIAAADKASQPRSHATSGPGAEDAASHRVKHEEKKPAEKAVPSAATAAPADRPLPMFDGKMLAAWEGDPQFLRVEKITAAWKVLGHTERMAIFAGKVCAHESRRGSILPHKIFPAEKRGTPVHPSSFVFQPSSAPRSPRPPHSSTPVPVLTVSGAAGAKANSLQQHRL